ncbi:MAG: hypothetical protein Q8L47_01320 [bacterium]|nr:hypothetical protein [bacterium]
MRMKKVIPANYKGGAKKPFKYCGKIVCLEDTEKDQQLLASFIEDCWQKQGGDDYLVSFTPTNKESVLWVSAKTKKRLNGVIDWAIDLLIKGFKQEGEKCIAIS